MKKLLLSSSGWFVYCALHAADPASLAFGGERIGVPPLSLSENITRGSVTTKPHQFGTGLPSYSGTTDLPNLGPNLLPPSPRNVVPDSDTRHSRAPKVSRESGMPIITPSDAVDYHMTVVPPNPSIDFKMIVKDVGGAAKTDAPK